MELVGTFLYVLQQFGVMLGVGSATFSLLFCILADRDGVIDASERRFMHAVAAVSWIALFLIIVSGFVITGAHLLVGEVAVAYAPAYLFKWCLIGILILASIFVRARVLPAPLGAALQGGSWYALFAIHILAPDATWAELIILYLMWIGLIAVGLFLITRASRRRIPVAPVPPLPLPVPHVPQTSTPLPGRPVPAKETPIINFPLR